MSYQLADKKIYLFTQETRDWLAGHINGHFKGRSRVKVGVHTPRLNNNLEVRFFHPESVLIRHEGVETKITFPSQSVFVAFRDADDRDGTIATVFVGKSGGQYSFIRDHLGERVVHRTHEMLMRREAAYSSGMTSIRSSSSS